MEKMYDDNTCCIPSMYRPLSHGIGLYPASRARRLRGRREGRVRFRPNSNSDFDFNTNTNTNTNTRECRFCAHG
jgi:hypothetical protein